MEVIVQVLWCYHCKENVPMLDDAEFDLIWAKNDMPSVDNRQVMLAEYNRLTESSETDWHVVFIHRISRYGPPCPKCGKALRTPVAYKCFECGHPVHLPNWSFLFAINDVFEVKGRGIVLIADREAIVGKVGIGDEIEIRSGLRIVVRTTIAGIEAFQGTPPSSTKVGVLLSPDVSREVVHSGQEVWLTGPPKAVP
jgi:hypothetical protein